MSGKAKGNPHHSAKGYVREVPTVVMDYMYMKEKQNEGEENGMPILVACDLVTARGGEALRISFIIIYHASSYNPSS